MNKFEVIKNRIIKTYPKINFLDKSFIDDLLLTFETNFQTDYFFTISVSKSLNFVQIGAQLKSMTENHYFWFIEKDKIQNLTTEVEEVVNFIFEYLDFLVNNKSRIIQKKNLLTVNFTLEYFEKGMWTKVSRRNGFRFSNLNFPNIESRIKTYQ